MSQHSSYLLVDICPIVDQQLQTEGTVGGDGSQVQRSVAALVGLVDISSVVDQLGSHRLLPHVAGHMERSVSKSVGLVNLTVKHQSDKRSDCACERTDAGSDRLVWMIKACWLHALMRLQVMRLKVHAEPLTSAPILSRYLTISM